MAFKIGDKVSIKHTTLSGEVNGAALDEVALVITYKVAYKDHDGIDQERYFSDDQIIAE
jgi:hypothetical protein